MALSDKDKKQLLGLAIFVALAGAGAFFYFLHMPAAAKLAETQARIDQLSAQVDSARRDLARGSVEALRQRVEGYQGAVRLMRRLVPEANEVPNLIDDVSSRAKRRGINVAQFTPVGVEPGSPFETHRYRWSVVGRYDQVGEFLSDIGSLPRIMVAHDVSVSPATATAARVYNDSSGALLEVAFQLRTFVKPPGGGADATRTGSNE
jgi:type IV pilus assembly protein PilO